MSFKDGAAGGFGDDDEGEDAYSDADAEVEEETSSKEEKSDQAENNAVIDSTNQSGVASSSSLPWIYSRAGITDGREKTVQLHLQQETLDIERAAKSQLEEQLGDTVNKADLREAAYLVGLAELDDVATQLSEWGYGIE